MRADLQELEITIGDLKRLTGLKCSESVLANGRKIIFMNKNTKFSRIAGGIFLLIVGVFFLSGGITLFTGELIESLFQWILAIFIFDSLWDSWYY